MFSYTVNIYTILEYKLPIFSLYVHILKYGMRVEFEMDLILCPRNLCTYFHLHIVVIMRIGTYIIN